MGLSPVGICTEWFKRDRSLQEPVLYLELCWDGVDNHPVASNTGYQFILRDKSTQIEGAEFKFLGLEERFERNKRRKFLNLEVEILEPKSKFRLGHA